MGENKSVEEQVTDAVSQAVETVPTKEAEVVPSTEVKPTETPAEQKPEDSKVNDVINPKINEELTNIKTALSIEREEKKQLKDELERTKSIYEKIQGAFAPEKEVIDTVETDEDKFEKWYSQKEQLKQEEENTKKTQDAIKSQIEKLSTDWNGEDGKPKYNDAEVYEWQKKNGKLYLMPEEAFFLMKQSDIIDYKAKIALGQAKPGVSAERPGGSSTEHAPEKIVPKTDSEIKNAVLEALSSAE